MASLVSTQIADRAFTVTPSDTAPNVHSYLYVGTGGNVAIVTEAGDSVTFTNVPSGSYIWIRTAKVMSTSTTASSIVGLV